MSKRATAATLEAAHDGPDYGAALAIINGRIANAKSAQSKASGDASQAWASIEKMGINKGGAQAAAKVLNMEDESDQQDWLRSFNKILEAAGITLKADLVDVAEGRHDRSVVPVEGLTPNHGRAEKPTGKPNASPEPSQPEGEGDGAGGEASSGEGEGSRPDEEPPVERPARKTGRGHLSVVDAKSAAAAHLSGKSPDALH